MAFESGISKYVHAVAKVDVFFPVDNNGREYCCCGQCFFYREASQTCGLNHQPVTFPSKYVGYACPLQRVTEEQDEKINSTFADVISEEKNEK